MMHKIGLIVLAVSSNLFGQSIPCANCSGAPWYDDEPGTGKWFIDTNGTTVSGTYESPYYFFCGSTIRRTVSGSYAPGTGCLRGLLQIQSQRPVQAQILRLRLHILEVRLPAAAIRGADLGPIHLAIAERLQSDENATHQSVSKRTPPEFGDWDFQPMRPQTIFLAWSLRTEALSGGWFVSRVRIRRRPTVAGSRGRHMSLKCHSRAVHGPSEVMAITPTVTMKWAICLT